MLFQLIIFGKGLAYSFAYAPNQPAGLRQVLDPQSARRQSGSKVESLSRR